MFACLLFIGFLKELPMMSSSVFVYLYKYGEKLLECPKECFPKQNDTPDVTKEQEEQRQR